MNKESQSQTQTVFLRNGNVVTPMNKANLNVQEALEPGSVYVVGFNAIKGQFFFEEMTAWEKPKKIYGDAEEKADRILKVFRDRNSSTGILLTGEKGSGKTLLSKLLAIKSNLPTLIVTSAFSGDAFKKCIHDVDQEVIILFDEFEKVYEPDNQNDLLTLLDGIYSSKKLFVFTANEKYKIQSPFFNRPGRLYYFLEYGGLNKAFIEQYCMDNLKESLYSHIKSIVSFSFGFGGKFNFDMLQALVQEMNRFDESPSASLKFLNIRPGGAFSEQPSQYNCSLTFHQSALEMFPWLSRFSIVNHNNPSSKNIIDVNFRNATDPLSFFEERGEVILSEIDLVSNKVSPEEYSHYLLRGGKMIRGENDEENDEDYGEEDMQEHKRNKRKKIRQLLYQSHYYSTNYQESELMSKFSSISALVDSLDVFLFDDFGIGMRHFSDISTETEEYIFIRFPFVLSISKKTQESFMGHGSFGSMFAF